MIKKLWNGALAALLTLSLLQSVPVSAFAADAQCSPWAELYLYDAKNMFIPEDMRGLDYTQPISRLELAELAYETMGYISGYFDYYAALTEANKTGNPYYETHGYEKPKHYPPVPKQDPFTDTDSDAAAALNAAGILLGKGDRRYAPGDTLTRQEGATVLGRMAAFFDFRTFPFENTFTDAARIADWAGEGVRTVCGMGLMVGMGDGTFSPDTALTREQTVAMLVRLIDSIPRPMEETEVAEGLSAFFNLMWMWVENEANEPVFYLPAYWGTYHYRTDYGYSGYDFLTRDGKPLCAAWGKADPTEEEYHTTIFDISTGEEIVSFAGSAGHYHSLTPDGKAVVLEKTVMGEAFGDWGSTYYGVYGFDGSEILPTSYTWDALGWH